jgi:hypothetical protein
VVTRRAGRVQFREPIDLGSPAGTIHVEPGRTLYLLTYLGEGFTKAWFSAEHKTAALAAWLVLANTRRKPPGGKR